MVMDGMYLRTEDPGQVLTCEDMAELIAAGDLSIL